MKSVAAFTKVVQTVYARQDAAARKRRTALRVSVPAKLSALVAQYPGVAVPVVDENTPARHRRPRLVFHQSPRTPVTDRVDAA
jgi:hypothetical protein